MSRPFIDTRSISSAYKQLEWIKVKAGEKFLPPHVQMDLLMRGGIIPGVDRGVDDTYMLAPPSSRILNKPQQAQGYAGGGKTGAPASAPTNNQPIKVTVYLTNHLSVGS